MHKQSATRCHECTRCGSDCVVTRGAGRVVEFEGVSVRVPEAMDLLRCHGCGLSWPTKEQATELRATVERDVVSDGGRGYRPVIRGT